jgi:hypothetical protein
MKNRVSLNLYIGTLLATFAIFGIALYSSNYINEKRAQELQDSEDKIAVDILSLETKYELINSSTCASYDNASLRSELSGLSERLSFLEKQVGNNDPEIYKLRRYYALLQIKDYLLNKHVNTECKKNDVLILYFYAKDGCEQCTKQKLLLDAIENRYDNVKVYSFDYFLDLSAVQTLISLHNIPANPPVLDINGKIYGPFDTYEDLVQVVDNLQKTSVTKTIRQ